MNNLENDQNKNPYQSLHNRSFWKPAVSQKSMFDINELWVPKFNIEKNDNVSTFGSCFAQHIGNALKSRGYNWFITEMPPTGMSENNSKLFGYNYFSARTGNIYTASLLRQWVEWSLGKISVPSEAWQKDGRFYDPFRPAIEPLGFKSEEEMKTLRTHSINFFRDCITKSDYFIFTLGLTESWFNQKGYEYPMCPGTVAGTFDDDSHFFRNQDYGFILENLSVAIGLMQEANSKLRFILTVSPVPLTATMSGNHVLVATMESKSILRAVAGQLANRHSNVDYFPSYEIINSPVFRGVFFEPNQRNVNPHGVDFVMNIFFNSMSKKTGVIHAISDEIAVEDFDENCEEALLEVYSGLNNQP